MLEKPAAHPGDDFARRVLLDELSAALLGPLGIDARLNQVARLSIPRLADACAVVVLENGTMRRAATGSLTQAVSQQIERIGQMPPPVPLARTIWESLEDGRPRLFDDFPRWVGAWREPAEDFLAAVEEAGVSALILAPITSRVRPVGCLFLTRLAATGRRYAPEDVALAEELARRCGLAIDAARVNAELEAQREALVRSEARYRSLAMASAQVVWVARSDGEVEEDLPTWRQLTGQTFDELRGRGWLNAIHPSDRGQLLEDWARSQRGRRPFEVFCRVRRASGGFASMAARGVPVFGAQGEIREWVGTFADMTEALSQEARLRQESRINEALVRIAQDFSRELDPEKLARRITDEAGALVGAELGAFFFLPVAGRPPVLHLTSGAPPPEPELLLAACERFPTAAEVERLDDASELLSGVGSALLAPVRSPSGEVLGGLFFAHPEKARFSDLHERMLAGVAAQAGTALENARLYRAVRESGEEARSAFQSAIEADRRKDEFLAMLGHELRNPLAPILTALEVMRLKEPNAATQKERQVIARQVRNMVRLVDDLLDVSRITRGKVELRREPVELGAVVAHAIEIASPLFEERAHHLSVDVPRDGLRVDADPARLAQVVSNLLNNAAKYTEPGGQIALRAWGEGEEAALCVEDNGMGISAELMPRLFELFVQGERTLERAQGGLGIGLSVAKSLVALHGGSLSARSDGVGRGSRFTLRLPLLASRGARVERSELLAKEGHGRVLVVDDNRDAADVLGEALESLGYEVRVAYDGPSALVIVDGYVPDWALLDIGLPVMDGYELAVRLRSHPSGKRLKLVAITGYGQEADATRARKAGFDAHLVKPVDLDQVVAALTPAPTGRGQG